jgi:hypothetical protein
MKYGDFSSLVQLEVGLHLGTALLQLYGELGMQPLVRTVERIKILISEEVSNLPNEIKYELSQLESDLKYSRFACFTNIKNM